MSIEEAQTLPAGWRWRKLGDLCDQGRQMIAPDSERARQLPYLSLEHIEAHTGRISRDPLEKIEDEGKSTTFSFDSRHVLYGKLRPYLNKVALPEFEGRCTTEAIPLLPCDGTSRQFLAWLLRREETVAAAMAEKTGSRMPRANMDDLLKLEVPIPPLPEQKRIAVILTEQMAAVEKARTAAEARLQAAKELPAAYLREVFESEEAQGWPRRTLGDVLIRIEAGKSFQTTERLASSDEVGVLKVSAVTWADFRPQEAKATEGSYEPAPHHRVRKGDILITRANTKELVGAVVHVDADYPNRLLSDKTLRLVVDESRISHGFLLQALRLTDARKHIEGNATGTSDSMRNIAQDTIRAIPLPLPPLAEQKRIESFLSVKARAIGMATTAASEELATIKSLPAALLRQAFAGEL